MCGITQVPASWEAAKLHERKPISFQIWIAVGRRGGKILAKVSVVRVDDVCTCGANLAATVML